MASHRLVNRVVGGALALGGFVFIALLAGVGSAQLTDDPPEVSPYQSGSTSLYEYGSPQTTTTAASSEFAIPRREVVIQDFAFDPAEFMVPLGTIVTFVNRESGVAHTSTSDDGTWRSGTLNPDDTFSHTFDVPGTFSYFCSIHPGMKAVITVEG